VDTLVMIPWRSFLDKIRPHRRSFTDQAILDHWSWATGGLGLGGNLSIIAFPGEYKKDDAECNLNQLIMVLTTAQRQRKALSLKDDIIMGIVGCRGQVQICSSYWEEDGSVSASCRLTAKMLSFV
jgi:hypothetical protein